MYYDNILATIGGTPLIKLNRVVSNIPATVLAKVETFNPGHSIKDRMALKMLEDAEKAGKIKPGGTIIECTSGNTGMGLAIAGAVKGYKCIFTTNDKQSKEKIDLLKALGAEVVVCPTNVGPEDPKSYYSVARKLSEEIPNSYWFNQYDNLSNSQAHFETTGPEIWEQTEGKITHLVVGVGTGGTISGTARFLKSKNPNIKVWGIDTFGSVFKKYHETGEFDEKEIYPYITEGIGEDILPKNVDFSVIDHFEKVTDKDGALAARRLAREEGLLMGYSAGSAVAGLLQMAGKLSSDDVVVVIFHDHGSRYVGKIFNDEWMRERGFIENEPKLAELILKKPSKELFASEPNQRISEILDLMRKNDLSQIPVRENGQWVGAITEHKLIDVLLRGETNSLVKDVMGPKLPIVDIDLEVSALRKYITKESPAVITQDKTGTWHIITNYDILQAI